MKGGKLFCGQGYCFLSAPWNVPKLHRANRAKVRGRLISWARDLGCLRLLLKCYAEPLREGQECEKVKHPEHSKRALSAS